MNVPIGLGVLVALATAGTPPVLAQATPETAASPAAPPASVPSASPREP
jgi:hypothetical protein